MWICIGIPAPFLMGNILIGGFLLCTSRYREQSVANQSWNVWAIYSLNQPEKSQLRHNCYSLTRGIKCNSYLNIILRKNIIKTLAKPERWHFYCLLFCILYVYIHSLISLWPAFLICTRCSSEKHAFVHKCLYLDAFHPTIYLLLIHIDYYWKSTSSIYKLNLLSDPSPIIGDACQ